MCTAIKQTAHEKLLYNRELSSVLCDDLEGREWGVGWRQEEGYMCILIALEYEMKQSKG